MIQYIGTLLEVTSSAIMTIVALFAASLFVIAFVRSITHLLKQ